MMISSTRSWQPAGRSDRIRLIGRCELPLFAAQDWDWFSSPSTGKIKKGDGTNAATLSISRKSVLLLFNAVGALRKNRNVRRILRHGRGLLRRSFTCPLLDDTLLLGAAVDRKGGQDAEDDEQRR